MTSPREAVSLLTAAALVVAPVGGVAATYTTGYAEDGDGHTIKDDRDHDVPASYEEAIAWIKEGKTLYKSCVEYMAANAGQFGGLTEAQHAELWNMAADDLTTGAESEESTAPEPESDPVPAETAPTPEGPKTQEPEQPQTQETPPSEPEESSEQRNPGDLDTPDMPDVPDTPDAPDTPDTPNAPDVPDTPDAPDTPDVPDNPEIPDQPENPDQPDTPDAPDTPDTPDVPDQPDTPDVPDTPDEPAKPDEPVIDTDNPVDSGIQNPGAAGGVTDESHTAAVIKGQAQTPLKQVAVTVPSISFTHIDNSAYVARHYSEDLTTEKFISLVGESARTIAAENDLYASVMIAQAILESASGNSTLAQAPNNNLFGIKGTYHGNSVQLPTREDDGTGATYTIMSDFRQYETVDESLSDYADLLSHSMGDFYAGARKSNSDSFVGACDFLVGRYATDIFYSEKLQDLIETYDLTRFDVPLTYELADTFVLPVKDEVTGLDKYLDPVTGKVEYEALVAEYRDYVARTSEYQQALAEWGQQMAAAEELYHVPVYLEKPSMPAADTPMQQHQDAIDAERFEGFDTLIATGQPLPVREARTLNDLTACANSFLGVPYLWGGTTPAGFDCSGLVQYCYREVFNIELPRTTYYQCEVGVEVPFEELLPGDLLFFADGGDVHHVAMYLGDGYYVEAPHTGDVVKITAMNDKLPDFAKRVVDVRSIDMSEFSDEQLAQFVEREKYLQEREQRLGVTDETLAELTEWLRGLEF